MIMAPQPRPKIEFFTESPLFTGLEKAEIDRLIELAEVQQYGPGQVIVAEGSEGDAIFLLYEGEISVSTEDKGGRPVTLATLREQGVFFGEVAMVDPGPRSATVSATTEAVLLRLSLANLEKFCGEFPDAQVHLLRNIARVLARRLRDSNVQLAVLSSS